MSDEYNSNKNYTNMPFNKCDIEMKTHVNKDSKLVNFLK
jgi:hypothetical protein